MTPAKTKTLSYYTAPILLHPLYPTAVTLLLLVTGGIGSVFSNEIRAAFPFVWPADGSVRWEAVVFWSLALVSAMAFFFQQCAVDRARRNAQVEMIERARELEHLIRTHPPANFLTVFAKLFDSADKALELSIGSPTGTVKREVVEEGIRNVLRIIATLAQEFDGDHPDTNYSANIMLFRASIDIPAVEREAVKRRLMFCDEAISVENLKGILDLRPELSTTARDKDAKPDADTPAIALPIPQTPKEHGKYRVLPGAPLAFVDKECDIYNDTEKLDEWCRKEGDFTQAIVTKLVTFFAENPRIRSFISIPLFERAKDGSDDKTSDPFAILNIHSDRPNLLMGQGEPVVHYTAIVRPFQLILVKLLHSHLKAPKSPPDNSGNDK